MKPSARTCVEGSEKPTRILYLMTSQLSGVLVQGQLAFLRHEGFDVTIGTRLIVENGPRTYDEGVAVRELPYVREPSISDLLSLWATWSLIREIRPSIVNSSTPKAGLIGGLAAWLARVPVRVYVVRGLRFETAHGWRRNVLRMMERAACSFATHVLFAGPSLRDLAEREGVIRRGRGIVLSAGSSNGVSSDRFSALPDRCASRMQLGIPDDAEVIGFVGRLSADKGIGDLIQALDGDLSRRNRLVLLLVGPFEEADPIDPGVRTTILHDRRVVHHSWLDQPGPAYIAMDVLAFPSYREGLPNVPLEAQLCARAVVAYSATGTVDAVVDGVTGVLVPVGDVDRLVAELESLLDDPVRRQAMGQAGHDWVRDRFDQHAMWTMLADRYRAWVEAATPVARNGEKSMVDAHPIRRRLRRR